MKVKYTNSMNKKPFTWSYSSLTAFETCPRKYFHTKVKKDVEDKMGVEALHGVQVHKTMEDAVAGRKAVPTEHKHLQPLVDKIRSVPGKKLLEYKVGLTKSLKPTEFFAKDVWLRCVIDFGNLTPERLALMDYKTGKPKEDFDQLGLFAGAGFAMYPHIEVVDTAYLWLKNGTMTRKRFHREDVRDEVWQPMLGRVTRMEELINEGSFDPRPSGLCRKHCPVKQCEFCGE